MQRVLACLVLSFFVVAFFNPREELGILFEAPVEQESTTEVEQGEKDEDEENKDSG